MKSKNIIKINESQLKQMISESVKKVLKEYVDYRDYQNHHPKLDYGHIWTDENGNTRVGRLGVDDIDGIYNTKDSQIEHDWLDFDKKKKIETMMTHDAMEYHPNYKKYVNPHYQDGRYYASEYVQSGGDDIHNEWNKQWLKQREEEKYNKLANKRPLHRKGSANRDLMSIDRQRNSNK